MDLTKCCEGRLPGSPKFCYIGAFEKRFNLVAGDDLIYKLKHLNDAGLSCIVRIS